MSSPNEPESQNKSSFTRTFFMVDWDRFPHILSADWHGVLINRTAPYPSEQEAQESNTWLRDRVKTNKLKVHSYGDFILFICVLRM